MYKKNPQHNHDKIFKAILVLLNSSALTLILFSYEKKNPRPNEKRSSHKYITIQITL